MKPMFSAPTWLALFASALTVQAAVQYLPEGLCATRQGSSSTFCGKKGTIKNPAPNPLIFPAFNAQECAQRCYDHSSPGSFCHGFSINPSKDNIHPGTCRTYTKTLSAMGFKANSSSSVVFYNANCYSDAFLYDSTIQDGGFSNSGSSKVGADPWGSSPEHYETTQGTGYGSFSTSYRHEDIPPSGEITQTFVPCPGLTYQLAYLDNSESFAGDLTISLNGVTVVSEQRDGDAATNGAPVYFTSQAKVEIAIVASTSPQLPGGTEKVDNVHGRAVYRGSLPVGTKIISV